MGSAETTRTAKRGEDGSRRQTVGIQLLCVVLFFFEWAFHNAPPLPLFFFLFLLFFLLLLLLLLAHFLHVLICPSFR